MVRGSPLHIIIQDSGGEIRDLRTITAATGLGLRSMKERAEIIGASLDFIIEPGQGWKIEIKVP
jgi:signal transduction histidine kinase